MTSIDSEQKMILVGMTLIFVFILFGGSLASYAVYKHKQLDHQIKQESCYQKEQPND